MICLLQAAGFQLREFEKREQSAFNDEPKPNKVKITLECGTSKMIAVLESNDVTCDCPVDNEDKDSSFWSITGSGPIGSSVKFFTYFLWIN